MKKTMFIMLAIVLVFALMPVTGLAATTVNTDVELSTALSAGGEVVLGADIDAGEIDGGSFFAVPGGVTVTFDLNGHTIQGTRILGTKTGTARNTAVIGNGGNLTIKDTTGGGQIVIDSELQDYWNSCTAAVSNSGVFTIESGTLINNGGTDMAYGIDTLSTGHTIINGGEVKSVNYIGIRAFGNGVTTTTDITVNGGYVYGASRGIWLHHSGTAATTINLIITGGTVESPRMALNACCFSPSHPVGGDSVNNTNITISGGLFINKSDDRGTFTFDEWYDDPSTLAPTVTVTGGVFQNKGSGGNIYVIPQLELILDNFAVSGGTFSAPMPDCYLTDDANITIESYSDTEITAGVDPSYMIIIPAAVDFGTLIKDTGKQSKLFPVQATGVVLEPGYQIKVAVMSEFEMLDIGGTGTVSLEYDLYNGVPEQITDVNNVFTAFNGDRTETGSIVVDTDEITAAGSYKGTMDFTISYGN